MKHERYFHETDTDKLINLLKLLINIESDLTPHNTKAQQG